MKLAPVKEEEAADVFGVTATDPFKQTLEPPKAAVEAVVAPADVVAPAGAQHCSLVSCASSVVVCLKLPVSQRSLRRSLLLHLLLRQSLTAPPALRKSAQTSARRN